MAAGPFERRGADSAGQDLPRCVGFDYSWSGVVRLDVNGIVRVGAALIGWLLAPACTAWKPLHEFDGWTLYVQDAAQVEAREYGRAFDPAFELVESVFGPFEDHVRVHAWHGGVDLDGGDRGRIRDDGEEIVHDVPGIGPAKVQAFHARGGTMLVPSGVFVGTADAGTAVHELVHARLAELERDLPLWLEEGLASLLGDGTLFEERWVTDGLCCWPLRELREEELADTTLVRLLALRPSDDYSVRENVLAHFVGWALLFDLYREQGELDWSGWIERYRDGIELADARERLGRTLDPGAAAAWLARLDDPDPGVRLAAAKGVWKLRDADALRVLVDHAEVEDHPEVSIGLAVNALAAAGEMRVDRLLGRRLWRCALRALRVAELADPAEVEAAHALYRTYSFGVRGPEDDAALTVLERFWSE
jgi:hypothetical protein